MADTGWVICGTGADDAAVGAVTWANPTNIQANDAADATAVAPGSSQTHYLKATNFNFSAAGLSSGDTIDGIEVTVERGGDGVATDTVVKQVNQLGAVVGDNKSTGAVWAAYPEAKAFGGAADLWGLTPSADDLLDADWGVVISATTGVPPLTFQVDYISMKITYTTPPAGGNSQEGPYVY